MAKVSVVIPVYNAKRTINQCLNSLAQQSYRDNEVIVIDNGSTDGSFELIKKFIRAHPEMNISLIKEEIKGSSPARNRGAKECSGEIIVYTDSDCVASQTWLEDIVNGFDDKTIGGVAGNIKGFEPCNLVEKFLTLFTLKGLKKDKVYSSYTILNGGFPTANLAIRREIFNKTGGFRGKIYGEDHDLCARVYQLGYRIKYIANGLVYHMHRNTLSGLIKQSFNFGECHARLFKTWGGRKVIIEFPKYTLQSISFFIPMWLNLNNADKKMMLLAVPGLIRPFLFILLLLYLLYLTYDIHKKCRRHHIEVSVPGKIGLVFLLLIKSFAMTCGKINGSIQEQVICL